MSCNNCGQKNQVIILKKCFHRICTKCIKEGHTKCVVCNDNLSESIPDSFLKNPDTSSILECEYCRPLVRRGSSRKKIKEQYLIKRCQVCLPIKGRGGKLVLEKSIIIENSYSNKLLKR